MEADVKCAQCREWDTPAYMCRLESCWICSGCLPAYCDAQYPRFGNAYIEAHAREYASWLTGEPETPELKQDFCLQGADWEFFVRTQLQ